MARRGDGGNLFIGRLSKNTRVRDLEEVFEPYGRITRCEIKYGPDMGRTSITYGFVDFEDRRDAADAIRYENGRSVCGTKIIVEWAKGNPRKGGDERPDRNGRFDRGNDSNRRGGYGRQRSNSRSRSYERRRSRSRS